MQFNNEIKVRNAVEPDTEFIVETIIQAEKGNGDSISYCKLFNINEQEFRNVLRKILAEKIGNFEFSLDNFKIAEADGIRVGAYGAWMEGKDGIASGILKISALRTFLGKQNFVFYKQHAALTDEISIRRQPGTLQFESIYIVEKYRGKNIGNTLVRALLHDLLIENPGAVLAQVQLIKQNALSLQAHQKYGFRVIEEKTSLNPEILNFYSGDTRVLMELKF